MSLTEIPIAKSVVINDIPANVMKDSLQHNATTLRQGTGKPMYGATNGDATYNRTAQTSTESPLSNGGLFVPNIDNSISLNAHHYGPVSSYFGVYFFDRYGIFDGVKIFFCV